MILIGCVDREAQKQAKRTEELNKDLRIEVQFTKAKTETVRETLEISGQITTASDVQIGPKAPGKVVAVYVRDGESVGAGQLIASMDTTPYRHQLSQALAQSNAARAQMNQAISSASITPMKSSSALRSARAQLKQAQESLKKLRNGARDQERKQAAAQVESAKSGLELAKKNLDRTRKLYSDGAISLQQVDQAENTYNAAASQLEIALQNQSLIQAGARSEDLAAAQQQVTIAEEAVRNAQAQKSLDVTLDQQVQAARANYQATLAQIALIRQSISDGEVRSPVSGRVAGNPVQPGTVLSSGTPIVRLIGAEGAYFDGEIPEVQMSRIHVGTPVLVTVDALGELQFSGSVASISPIANSVGRSFSARINLSGPINALKPGMFARGLVEISRIENAVLVPTSSIVTREGKSYVFVRNQDKVRQVEVTPGLRSGPDTTVTGIAASDEVVEKGQETLSDGSAIRVSSEEPQGTGTGVTTK